MERKRKLLYTLVAGIILAAVGIIIAVYSLIIGSTVETKTVNNINELATHDKNTIDMFITYNWRNLQRMGARLNRTANTLDSRNDLNVYLDTEAQETPFDEVYLVAEDGSYYTGVTYVDAEDDDDFLAYDFKSLFANGRREVISFDELPTMRGGKVIIYGYRLDGTLEDRTICGKKMYALIGVNNRSSLRDGLIINSFADEDGDSRGHSSIISLKGDYIVNINYTASVDSDNWLNHIQECKKSDLTYAQVLEKMEKGEPFWFYHKDGGKRELNYCVPFGDDIDWYFLLSVDDIALAEQTSTLVWMIVIALSIAVIIIIVAMVIIIMTQNKTAKALAQEKAQSEFLSNMSHEIRTPLNGLVGLNYLIMTSINDPDKKEQVKEWLAKSHSTANYLLSLINDVLDISKLRAGKVEIIHEPLLVETVMDAIYSMQYSVITGRGIEYLTDINITVPCILGDEVHIKQVLMNIVGNAAKFTPSGGFIKLSVNQEKTDETHVVTTFTCEDSGCGMSKEFLTKIFDAFSQDRNSNSSSIKGTGLGMAISKLLVTAMGGEINVESELEKGSKFTVSIPSEISDMPEYMKVRLTEETQKESVAQKSEKLKILVAEDNELNAEILMEILQDAGFEPSHAQNGEEAVKMFESSAPNEFAVILMDMQMPVMDGCAASEAIRALFRPDAKTVKIFACTANTFKEDRLKAYDSGMNDFLTKPIDVKVLLQKMESLGEGDKE